MYNIGSRCTAVEHAFDHIKHCCSAALKPRTATTATLVSIPITFNTKSISANIMSRDSAAPNNAPRRCADDQKDSKMRAQI